MATLLARRLPRCLARCLPRRPLALLFPLLVASATIAGACGSSTKPVSSTAATSSSTGTSSSKATVAASSSTTGAGGAGTGGSSGAGGSVVCPVAGGLAELGKLDGKPFQLHATVGDASAQNGFGVLVVDADGLLVYAGPSNAPMGQASPITGFFRLPTGGADQLHWYALGAGSTLTPGPGTLSFSLAALRDIGSCPQAQGSGDLAFCFDDQNLSCGGAETSTTGMVMGTSFDWSTSLPS